MNDDEIRSAYLLHVTAAVVQHGFALVPVGFGQCSVPGCPCEDDGDAWAYTVGLVEEGHPELIVLGLQPPDALELCWWVVEEHRAGRTLVPGEERTDGPLPVVLDPVPPDWLARDPSRMAVWLGYYGPGREPLAIPALAQLVWGDERGRFPGDPECAPWVADAQPDLAAHPFAYPRLPPRWERRRRRRAA